MKKSLQSFSPYENLPPHSTAMSKSCATNDKIHQVSLAIHAVFLLPFQFDDSLMFPSTFS